MTTKTLTPPIAPASRLPGIVEHYLERALPAGGSTARAVRIVQKGEMTLKPDGRPLPFDAVEELAVGEVGFTWRAKVHVAPFVSIRVVDAYRAGKGSLDARLFGLPVARGRGQETNAGQAMRYLAELAWVPQALTANSALEWHQLEDDIVEVATCAGSSEVAVALRFDRNGDILAVFGDRPHREGRRFVPRHWIGIYGDYAELGGSASPPLPRFAGSSPTGRSSTGAARSPRSSPPSPGYAFGSTSTSSRPGTRWRIRLTETLIVLAPRTRSASGSPSESSSTSST